MCVYICYNNFSYYKIIAMLFAISITMQERDGRTDLVFEL